jgi:hypothetical protein
MLSEWRVWVGVCHLKVLTNLQCDLSRSCLVSFFFVHARRASDLMPISFISFHCACATQAYKRAMLKIHPDKHMHDELAHLAATERFKALNEAFVRFKKQMGRD